MWTYRHVVGVLELCERMQTPLFGWSVQYDEIDVGDEMDGKDEEEVVW